MRTQEAKAGETGECKGLCAWCNGFPGVFGIRAGHANMVFFEGYLCHFCTAKFTTRLQEDDDYLTALLEADTPHDLILNIMRQRYMRQPQRYEA